MSISKNFDWSLGARFSQHKSQPLAPTVLVVDDNDDTRQMMRTLLTIKGYRVFEAADGEEAIQIVSSEEPGLVLLDLQLPRMNGLNVIRQLRSRERLTTVPLVVMTGYDKHFDTAVAAGCDDYMVKPIDFDRLGEILDYYVPIKAERESKTDVLREDAVTSVN
jgi:CheY-like chemotaxis protein